MRGWARRQKESFVERMRDRWSGEFAEPGLTEFAVRLWQGFVLARFLPIAGFILAGLGIAARGAGVVSVEVGFLLVVGAAVLLCSGFFWSLRRVKRTAGRIHGLTDEQARKLDIYGPERFREKLAEIRRAQSERRA